MSDFAAHGSDGVLEGSDGSAEDSDRLVLTAEEVRVLGCLLEKERTTPDDYPLTLNAIMRASNQTTNRDPVMQLQPHEVESALGSLRELGLIRVVYSPSNRAAKYRHVVGEALRLGDGERALLCVLLLRGPQTPGELKARSERLHHFADLGEVHHGLTALSTRSDRLVVELDRLPGHKEARWAHLLAGEPVLPVSAAEVAALAQPRSSAVGELRDRVEVLERQVAHLTAVITELVGPLGSSPDPQPDAGSEVG